MPHLAIRDRSSLREKRERNITVALARSRDATKASSEKGERLVPRACEAKGKVAIDGKPISGFAGLWARSHFWWIPES